jgi:Lipid A 3-O-deacylase (PagL)
MRFRTGTPRLRFPAFVLLLIAACATTARADVVSAGAGKGLLFSKDYGGWFLHYYHDAPTQSCGPCFLGLTAGTWPGEAAATIVAASAGWRATFGEHDLGAGLTHVSNGDFVLHTGKPNDGENFLTVELGRRF